MTAISTDELAALPVEFKLNGKDVVGYGNETIIQTAQRLGVEIPRLCYKEGMRPDGNCRSCMVEIKGERVLAPSCCRYPTSGMEVTSNSAINQRLICRTLQCPSTSTRASSARAACARAARNRSMM